MSTDRDWIRPDGKGGVYIGEAPVPAAQIGPVVALIHRTAGRPAPIVLPRSSVLGEDAISMTYNGARIVRDGQRVNVPAVSLLGYQAKAFGAIVAQLGEIAEAEPDAADLERLTAFFDESMDAEPEHLARMFLRRFKAEERAS